MDPGTRFEHIAIAVHVDDLPSWDRSLRCDLGGSASLGGKAQGAGFQGGQITYPDGGMLELLTWLPHAGERSATRRYLARHGSRAALHHLTFLVDDFDAAVEHCRSVGYEPMLGRQSDQWSEFFVREPALLPAGLLIQVLRADKDALVASGWSTRWEPFAAHYPDARAAARVNGVHLACSDARGATRMFVELLGAETTGADSAALRWPASSMCVWLHTGARAEDSHVEIRCPDVTETVSALRAGPAGAAELLRCLDA